MEKAREKGFCFLFRVVRRQPIPSLLRLLVDSNGVMSYLNPLLSGWKMNETSVNYARTNSGFKYVELFWLFVLALHRYRAWCLFSFHRHIESRLSLRMLRRYDDKDISSYRVTFICEDGKRCLPLLLGIWSAAS